MPAKDRRQEHKRRAVEALGNMCKMCGNSFNNLDVYDFHHVRENSIFNENVSRILNCSWRRIKKQLKHCILLCANCHRLLHSRMYKGTPPELLEYNRDE